MSERLPLNAAFLEWIPAAMDRIRKREKCKQKELERRGAVLLAPHFPGATFSNFRQRRSEWSNGTVPKEALLQTCFLLTKWGEAPLDHLPSETRDVVADALDAICDSSDDSGGRYPIGGMRLTGDGRCFGREEQQLQLTDAWRDPRVFCVVVDGIGGIGKTTLVHDWLVSLSLNPGNQTARIFVWQFSEGASDDGGPASAASFFDEALRYFDYENPARLSKLSEKSRELLERVRRFRTLFVLDGLETLEQPRPLSGKSELREPALAAFIEGLASANSNGLCVITTREPLIDFVKYEHHKAALSLPLDRLGVDAGRDMLKSEIGLQGDPDAFCEATEACNGHPLVLRLLGVTLKECHRGRIESWQLPFGAQQWPLEIAISQFDQLVHYYESKLKHKLAHVVLRLQGFFRGPASLDALTTLSQDVAVAQVPGWERPVSRQELEAELTKLSAQGLLVKCRTGNEITYDAHAFVRSFYSRQLRQNQSVWRRGHKLLFDFYRIAAESAETIDPVLTGRLFVEATFHGCGAGWHKDAAAIYWNNIAGREESFRARPAGDSFPRFLDCLSHFFEKPWDVLSQEAEPGQQLPPEREALILEDAGHYLFLTGQLEAALAALEKGIKIRDQQITELGPASEETADLRGAAKHSRIVRELFIAKDNLVEAEKWARKALSYSPRRDPVAEHAALGQVLHYLGRNGEAKKAFDEAKTTHRDFLDSFAGYWHCEFQLARFDAVLSKRGFLQAAKAFAVLRKIYNHGDEMLKVAEGKYTIEEALAKLVQGQALARQVALGREDPSIRERTAKLLDEAYDQLRLARQQHHFAVGLLACAEAFTRIGRADRAETRLKEALQVARLYGMHRYAAQAQRRLDQLPSYAFSPAASGNGRPSRIRTSGAAVDEASTIRDS
ncbi:MAG: hypothetical protein KY475_11315 [Planctomycetes bacterium]|nr:hypothetical protein [Planctomycetota bacterium]